MKKLIKLFLLIAVIGIFQVVKANDESLKLQYNFEDSESGIIKDITGNGNDGSLKNGATIEKEGENAVLFLGSKGGYLDMGLTTGNLISSLEDFTISTFLKLDKNTNISGDGNFLWVFSTENNCTESVGKYISYRVNRQRYSQATGGYNNEKVAIESGQTASRGNWMHVVYTQAGKQGHLFINGKRVASGRADFKPSDIGQPTKYNWIGRPQFRSDAYLANARISDFRIYNRSLNQNEIKDLFTDAGCVMYGYAKTVINNEMQNLQLKTDTAFTHFKLPATTNEDVEINWLSSNKNVSSNGFINRLPVGSNPQKVKLTAHLNYLGETAKKEFEIVLMPEFDDKTSVSKDLLSLNIIKGNKPVRSDLILPESGIEGSNISWKSSDLKYLDHKGRIVSFPEKGKGDKIVHLTATAIKGKFKASKKYKVIIPENEGYSSYLFAYFTGNSGNQEAIRFALSPDGLNFKALNNNKPVISSDTIADNKAVRDPHILRGHDGKTFYMVVTDMKSDLGWNSNHGMVLLKSNDLINWTHSRIDIRKVFPEFSRVNRVWAPQTIYDKNEGKYMIYWSMRSGNDPDVIYYAYTNDSFTELISQPKVLFDNPLKTACIDGDIIFENGVYNLFFKTEGSGNGIKRAEAVNITGPYIVKNDKYLQQTTNAVEGSCVYRLINSDKYMLIYDVYANGRYEFTESTDLDNFKLKSNVSMDFFPRHGTVIPITSEEAQRLAGKWGELKPESDIYSISKQVKINNIIVDKAKKSIVLPVYKNTDLKSFNPELVTIPGAIVKPAGKQNFTKGAVKYTFSLNGQDVDYMVEVIKSGNPVLAGYYADPEVLYSEKTGKYYIYPTSDGYPGWAGTTFKVFTSEDLVDWKDQGPIIELSGNKDVTWANRNAWAPCMVEKKLNGKYKYFFYYTAAQKVGVAVADHPEGPFFDSGRPLINQRPAGVRGGQEIDPDVFTDPVTNKSYLYWGNGYMAGAELNEDMVSVDMNTLKIMTPDNTYREGTYVFYRNGRYYFLWSQDDTGSPNYSVRYGYSTSPLGKLTIPANNLVITREDSKAIYGPGHNSVLQIPGKDEWYIVYHRFTRPKGIEMRSPGYYREVCIDKMTFDTDGNIVRVIPGIEGVDPVKYVKK